MGFPTANIEVPETYKLLPSDGAYAVRVKFEGKQLNGMLNIGFKPTVEGTKRTIETHLFNFDEQIYGKQLTIEFIASLRKELKFESMDKLRDQLELDKLNAIKELT